MLLAASFITVNNGCKKDDPEEDSTTTPPPNDTTTTDSIAPVITLSGSSMMTITLNSSYTDPGATANDAHDGAVSVTSDASTSNPNINLAGVYTITYTAVDSAGNSSQSTRTVHVRNDAYYLEGFYICIENGVDTFTQSISTSPSVNNRILFSAFANYFNNALIFADVSATSLSLPTQTAMNIGSSGCDHVFAQMGPSTITIVSTKASFTISFSDEQLSGGICNATSPVPYSDSFQQQ